MSLPAEAEPTVHATALVVSLRGRAFGILVTGPSGAGKSSLALALIERAATGGGYARLVADDRVVLRTVHGRLLASAPPALAGRIEMHGLGIATVPHLATARIHARVKLAGAVERMPEPAPREWRGVTLPSLAIARADPLVAPKVEYWLTGNMQVPSLDE